MELVTAMHGAGPLSAYAAAAAPATPSRNLIFSWAPLTARDCSSSRTLGPDSRATTTTPLSASSPNEKVQLPSAEITLFAAAIGLSKNSLSAASIITGQHSPHHQLNIL